VTEPGCECVKGGAPPLDWRPILGLALALTILYGFLYKAQWVPGGGDDAYYLVVARNIVASGEYRWAGQPVLHYPPGWPFALAAVLSVSPSFALLNLLILGCVVGAACIWYRILLRLTTPRRALVTMLVVGAMFEWHRFTYTLYAEGAFFLALSAALLLAFQISEGKCPMWRGPLLAFLCVALVLLRWAGLVMAPLVAGVLVHGRLWPRWDRRWVCAGVACIAFAGTFVSARVAVRRHAEQMLQQASTAEQKAQVEAGMQSDEQRLVALTGQSKWRYARRFAHSGQWLAMLFWPPATVGMNNRVLGLATNVTGWALLLLFLIQLVGAVRRREWIWAGCAAYAAVLVFEHYRPVARYLAPVAPLVLLGIWHGLDGLLARAPRRQRLTKLAVGGLMAAILACNLALFGLNAWFIRSADFASEWLAGEYGELAGIAQHLGRHGVQDAEVAIAVRYDDPYRRGRNTWARRLIYLLGNYEVLEAPPGQDTASLAAWANARGVRYVVGRPPNWRRRIWHFRLGWHSPSDQPEDYAGPEYYALYGVESGGLTPVAVSDGAEGVTTVPGL